MSSLKNVSRPKVAALTCCCNPLSLIWAAAKSRRLNDMSLKPLARYRRAWPSGATASVCITSTASSSWFLTFSSTILLAISWLEARGRSMRSSPLDSALAVQPSNFCCFLSELSTSCGWTPTAGSCAVESLQILYLDRPCTTTHCY